MVLSGSNARNYKHSKINLKDKNSTVNQKTTLVLCLVYVKYIQKCRKLPDISNNFIGFERSYLQTWAILSANFKIFDN